MSSQGPRWPGQRVPALPVYTQGQPLGPGGWVARAAFCERNNVDYTLCNSSGECEVMVREVLNRSQGRRRGRAKQGDQAHI